jgi:hypothetical protein
MKDNKFITITFQINYLLKNRIIFSKSQKNRKKVKKRGQILAKSLDFFKIRK